MREALGKGQITLGKAFVECGTRQRTHGKKIDRQSPLCRVSFIGHLAKALPRAPGALGKEFFKKKIKNLCRVPVRLALGKATVNGAGAMTVAFLCRVPLGLSAKPVPSAR